MIIDPTSIEIRESRLNEGNMTVKVKGRRREIINLSGLSNQRFLLKASLTEVNFRTVLPSLPISVRVSSRNWTRPLAI